MNKAEKIIRHLGLYKLWFFLFERKYQLDRIDLKNTKIELEEYCHNVKASCIQDYTMNMNELKASIIVPAYNAESYIKRCLNSLISQETVYSYEIIVVNDGSTDGTLELLSHVKSDKLRIIDKPNGGISSARNAGVMNALGEYLIFCDADDYMDVGAVQNLIEKAEQTDADVVEGSFRYISENGRVGRIVKHKGIKRKFVNTFGVPWGKCIRKSLFQGICFPEGYWFEDSIIHQIILSRANKIEWIEDVVYYYRTNSNGATSSSAGNPKSIDSLWISISLLEDRRKLGLNDTVDYYLYMLNMLRLGFHRTELLPEKIRRDFYYEYAAFLNSNFETKLTGILTTIDTEKGYMELRMDDGYKYYNFRFEEKKDTEILTSNTLFLRKKDGKYGYVDKNEQVVVDYIYDDATKQNQCGYAGVKKDGKWGSIGSNGNVIIEPTYDLENYLLIDFIGRWHLGQDINMNYYNQNNN